MSPSRPIDIALIASTPLDIVVPDIGDRSVWRLRLELPGAAGSIRMCRVQG